MSYINNKEPKTNGKVIISTSLGDLQVELWGKQAPNTCRNFIQLAYNDLYCGSCFHQIIPNRLVKGGRIKNDSEKVEPFKAEFNQRLNLRRRGILAMSNIKQDDKLVLHQTEFFITLGPTEDLEESSTVFGKITGDSIYNLVKIGNEATNKSITDILIKGIKVLVNPFIDIIPNNIQVKSDIDIVSTPIARKSQECDEAKKKKLAELEEKIKQLIHEIRNPSLDQQISPPTLSSTSSEVQEADPLLELNRFCQKLKSSNPNEAIHSHNSDEKFIFCKLHGLVNCKSCQDTFFPTTLNDDEGKGNEWITHKLVFAESEYSRSIKEKQRNDLNDLIIIDPTEKTKKFVTK